MDFMADVLVSDKRFRTLNIIDDYNREALAIEIDTSLSAARGKRVLQEVIAWRESLLNSELIRVQSSSLLNSGNGVKKSRFICNIFSQEGLHRMLLLNASMAAFAGKY